MGKRQAVVVRPPQPRQRLPGFRIEAAIADPQRREVRALIRGDDAVSRARPSAVAHGGYGVDHKVSQRRLDGLGWAWGTGSIVGASGRFGDEDSQEGRWDG